MKALYYILEANAYLAIFYAFYLAFLKKETFYLLNRIYFLLIPGLAFLLPSFRISGLHPQVISYYATVQPASPAADPSLIYIQVMAIVYLAIALFFSGRLVYRIRIINRLIKQGTLRRDGRINLVNLPEHAFSFSFLNYLFMQTGSNREETIIRHEKVHIRQFHSVDVLFYEFIRIISWFNPVIPFMQRDLKAIHEFIADELTAREEESPAEYALFLIRNSYTASTNRLANPIFNKSLLKQRIMKLNQQKSAGIARLKYALLLLLLPTMVFTTAKAFDKEYGLFDLTPQSNSPTAKTKFKAQELKLSERANADKAMLTELMAIQRKRGLTGQEIAGYTNSLDRYNKEVDQALAVAKKNNEKVDVTRFPPASPSVAESAITDTGKVAPPPPPKPKVDQVRFPAPKVQQKRYPPPPPAPVKDNTSSTKLAPPPPPEPPKPKVDRVRFPAPKVNSKKNNGVAEVREEVVEEPPVVKELHPKPKVDQVRFPPPAPAPAGSVKEVAPRPKVDRVPPKPKVDQVRFPPPAPPKPKVDQVRFPAPAKSKTGVKKDDEVKIDEPVKNESVKIEAPVKNN